MPIWPFRRRRESTAFLGLGANLGDRLDTIRSALVHLDEHDRIVVEVVSGVYETEPVVDEEAVADQPPYLNCAVRVTTTLDPHALKRATQEIESVHGRDRAREERWGPRTLDIDLLLYEHETIDDPDLVIPHPQLTERAFVLVPLAEVLPPGATLPDGTSVASRLAKLAPITGVEFHVRLVEGPGTEAEPMRRRPPGPPGGPPRLGERRGGPGRDLPTRRDRGAGRDDG